MNSGNAPFILAMSTLGRNGRFANQVFQYAFLRFTAREYDCVTHTPQWIGQKLFGHADKPLAPEHENTLLEWRERAYPDIPRFISPGIYDYPKVSFSDVRLELNETGGINFWGHFQSSRYYAKDPDFFRSLFQPEPELAAYLDSAWQALAGKTVVVAHLRFGDTGQYNYFETPLRWVHDWLESFWPQLDSPVLYLATEDARVKRKFKDYAPLAAADIFPAQGRPGVLAEAPYYEDFWAISQADCLGISNSSFAFAAAMLNSRCSRFARPKLSARGFVDFSPWQDEVLCTEATPNLIFWRIIARDSPDIYNAVRKLQRDLMMNDDTLDTPIEEYERRAWEALLREVGKNSPEGAEKLRSVHANLRKQVGQSLSFSII
ncbi:hypothetical protein LJC48_01915 [Desulfovibrio sp. OttesenSCG-928-C06]|nr:hypothetical protein [Desulfovibrio sp. OttesenSCG-928-C06]